MELILFLDGKLIQEHYLKSEKKHIYNSMLYDFEVQILINIPVHSEILS